MSLNASVKCVAHTFGAILVMATAAPAWGQDRGSKVDTIGSAETDIIVTAQRREERLQEVPISITVFNQQSLDDKVVLNGRDLAAYTPSLTANARFGSNNTTFAIRGFTQDIRATPSVGVYFAEVVAPRAPSTLPAGDGAGAGSFFDLQNVQVLKGPQGTLFGRNTTGGAILLVPQRPTDALEGFVEGSYGSRDYVRVQGALNIPLADTFKVRLGFDKGDRDGFVRNSSPLGPKKFGDLHYLSFRGSILADLAPNLEAYFLASYNRSKDNGVSGTMQKCYPNVPLFGPLACAQIEREKAFGPLVTASFFDNPETLNESWQVINHLTWQINDDIKIRNIASYAEIRSYARTNLFGTYFITPALLAVPTPGGIFNIPTGPFAGLGTSFATTAPAPNRDNAHAATFTEEFQVQGTSGRLEWQAGAYLEKVSPLGEVGAQSPILSACSSAETFQCIDVLGTLTGRPGLIGSLTYGVGSQTLRTIGTYAQGTYELADTLKLTAGIRYTWDTARATRVQATYRFFTPNVATGFCTFPDGGVSTTIPFAGTNAEGCRANLSQKTQAPTWVLGLDWTPTPDVLLYGKYSRGYRQGSVDPYSPAPYNKYEAEKVDAYEVGTKYTFRGAVSGNFNVAAFYNDFTNQQLTVGAISSTNTALPTQLIVNAGRSRIWGFEVESTIIPFDGLRLSASYAYLNTKLKSFSPPVQTPGSPYDIFNPTVAVGRELSQTPKNKLSVSANYTLPLPASVGEIDFGATYTYTDNITVSISPDGILPAYSLVNLNVNWRSVLGSPIDLSLFATNVTKKRYYLTVNDLAAQGFVSRLIGEPRAFGVRLKYSFGQ